MAIWKRSSGSKGRAGEKASRYSAMTVFLHWLTVLIVVAIYAAIEAHEMIPQGNSLRAAAEDWHIYLGFLLLAIAALRLYNSRRRTDPPISPAPPLWQLKLTVLMKKYLYLLMIGTPLLGWIALSADGAVINVGAIPLPAIAPEYDALADTARQAHALLGLSGYLLIPLHALAALVHHYLFRNNTLERMLPGSLMKRP